MKKEFSTYSVIPTEIMLSKDLSSTTKVLYGLISSLTNEKGYCWASNKYLSDLLGITERQVSNNISQLVDNRYIVSDVEKNYKRKIRLVISLGGRKKTAKGYAENSKGGSSKLLYNNIKEYYKDNNILADKSANDNLNESKPNIKITDLYAKMGLPKPIRKVNQWQDEASNAVKYFVDSEDKVSSIFKCYKDNQQKARIALSDCKELGKKNVLYFLKVYNELKTNA
jgi:DNA-binding MarR family transcriptional regulator